jgi:hypothetical protein
MGLLYGRAGRLTAENGGFRSGQCWAELTRRSVKAAPPVVAPDVFSAFPLLEKYTMDY